MKTYKSYSKTRAWLTALLVSALVAGCNGGRDPILGAGGIAAVVPTVTAVAPIDNAFDVPVNTAIVTAVFSEAMAPITGTASFTLECFAPCVNPTGTVALDATNTIATFTLTPATSLAPATAYVATITAAQSLATGVALASPYVWHFTTAAGADTTQPTVTATVPLATTPVVTGVAVNSQVTATFSKDMTLATIIDPATFTLACPTGTPVTGTVDYVASSRIATFTPAADLPLNVTCTATISTAAQDIAGLALASPFVWSFATGLTSDTTAPILISTGAFDGESDLPVNRDSTAIFSEPMDPATITSPATSFTVTEFLTGLPVAGVVTYSGYTATFNPNSNLQPLTKYTSTITNAAEDLAGNALVSGVRPNPWSWTTSAAVETTAPTITLTNPADLAIDVLVDKKINATFSEDMKQSTMTTANITVQETILGTPVTGTVAYDAQNFIATFLPLANLNPDTDYTVTVTNGAQDLAGNALVVPAVGGLPVPNPWTFKTAAAVVPPADLAINLRGAASFGIASRAGLTSTGVTVVNGDVALYPTATCTDSTGNAGASQTCLTKIYTSPTGMTVNGSIYFAGDPFDNGGTANSVTNDLNIAWTEGMNKADTQGAIAADEIGGKIFFPGVYHNATLGLMAGGTATMDAQGDANAVFIFKVDSSFVDSGTLLLPTTIALSNGAQARNIWFVTGLDITIGSGTTWNGNILAGRTATINDGSAVMGRVLAGASGAGALTLTGAASPSLTSVTVPQ